MADRKITPGGWFAIAAIAAIAVFYFLAKNDRAPTEKEDRASRTSEPNPAHEKAPVAPFPQAIPVPGRLVAIGDLHGDLAATRRVLKLAGAIDDKDKWVGANLVVVQTGDEIDRGDDDRAILDLFARLETEAKAAGGRVVPLLGNHEVMNAEGDFRYVTPGSNGAFTAVEGRQKAFAPGGAYAKILSTRDVVAIVGDSVFVHGGVLPSHTKDGLLRANTEARAWLAGTAPKPSFLSGDDSLVWTRRYSSDDVPPACAKATEAIAAIGVKRMVVGHTVQPKGVNSVCEGKVWRIDVGLSSHYGGPTELLEIKDGEARPVRAP